MMLLEHHAKALLKRAGLVVPSGILATRATFPEALVGASLPAVVKAQVPVGGRGKAGGIVVVHSAEELAAAVDRQLGMMLKGCEVRACRIEEPIAFISEAYVSLSLNPAEGNVAILMSAEGGVHVEDPALRGHLLRGWASLSLDSVLECVHDLVRQLPPETGRAMAQAAPLLAEAFFDLEALLVEINPLFLLADGSWVAGDAKIVLDDNAQPRNEILTSLITDFPELYPDAALKLEHGFDYVVVDPEGDIGLVTTGAGLSMQLVDELVARGHRPFNFCDIRTGQFRGDPARLIQVLRWIAAAPNVRAVLINFFAGHTDLGEISNLLIDALAATPELEAPIVARMIGNGLEQARANIAAAGNPIMVETDLERAIDLTLSHSRREIHVRD